MATLTQAGITFGDGTLQSTASTGFTTGTVMLFVQSAAPTGWTKSTAHNDKALRVVSGSVSSGGSVAFSDAFTTALVGATTLSTAQMPSHDHPYTELYGAGGSGPLNVTIQGYGYKYYSYASSTTDTYYSVQGSKTSTAASQGGGGSHTHTFPSLAVQYVDVIICTKN